MCLSMKSLRALAAASAMLFVSVSCSTSSETTTDGETVSAELTETSSLAIDTSTTSVPDELGFVEGSGSGDDSYQGNYYETPGNGGTIATTSSTVDTETPQATSTTGSSAAANQTQRSKKSSSDKSTSVKDRLPERDPNVIFPNDSYVATVTNSGVSSSFDPESGTSEHWFPNPTQFGGPRVFLVVDDQSKPDYVKVSLPIKPNGQEGWIPRDSVTIAKVNTRAVIDLTSDAITVWDGNDVLVQTKVVTGKSSTPTPVGQFFVRDIIKKDYEGGAYGPYIVALSGFSEVLETFAGGLPAIAVHGTNKPWLIGGEHSNGCIRIPNDLIQVLAANVALGTPVTIVA